MSAVLNPGETSAVPVWWCDQGANGLRGYVGAANDGLEFTRHSYDCKPGLWRVAVTGWMPMECHAAVDDFGNLVRVQR